MNWKNTTNYFESSRQRFSTKYELNSINGCWEWKTSFHPTGYGAFWFRGDSRYAHRVSWIFNRGEITDSLHVLHRCDNPRCVNPDHLFLGTQQDNVADRDRKGRGAKVIGPKRKFSPVDVRRICDLHNRSGITLTALSKMYNCTLGTIKKVADGTHYKEVPRL